MESEDLAGQFSCLKCAAFTSNFIKLGNTAGNSNLRCYKYACNDAMSEMTVTTSLGDLQCTNS